MLIRDEVKLYSHFSCNIKGYSPFEWISAPSARCLLSGNKASGGSRQ